MDLAASGCSTFCVDVGECVAAAEKAGRLKALGASEVIN